MVCFQFAIYSVNGSLNCDSLFINFISASDDNDFRRKANC